MGEVKYGKPMLDRIINNESSLDDVARCALVSMDSTMRSNATVGPPIELALYTRDTLTLGRHLILEEDVEFLREIKNAWQENLQNAFANLPALPAVEPPVRLADG